MADDSLRIADDFPPVSLEQWRTLLEKDLKGAAFESLRSDIEGNLSLEPLYTLADAADDAVLGVPGLPPYVRGGAPVLPTVEGWVVRQEYDDPRMAECARAIRDDLDRGAQAVWLRCGGHHGTRILTAGDLAVVLDGVDLRSVSVCLEPEVDALPMAAAFAAVARHRGVPFEALRGCFGADPLGSLARTGGLAAGLSGSMSAATDLTLWSAEHTPGMRALLASSRPYADAGATTVDELAWTLATAVAYLRAGCAAGLSVDRAAAEVQFALSVSGHFYIQIAKLRAARLLWSKVVAAAGGSPAAQRMALHARTATFTKTQRDPWVNMLRATTETFAAAVGGADSVATTPFDALVGPSDAFARRVARNTQLVLRDESHLHRVVDPAGGSFMFEALTDQLARAAWKAFQEVEALGGMDRALGLGHVARVVEKTRERRMARLSTRKDAVVGVSEFPHLTEEPVVRTPVDMEEVEVELGNALGEAAQDTRLDKAAQDTRLDKTRELAALAQGPGPTGGRLTAMAIEAAELGVDLYTMGVLLAEGRASLHLEPLPVYRAASPFEALRDAADTFRERTGARPTVFLANMGTVAQHTARATWMTNVLAAGGIAAVDAQGWASHAEAAEAFVTSGCRVAVVTGPDDLYATEGVALVEALRGSGATFVAVAGRPGELEAALRGAGAGRFIFAGLDILSVLEELQRELGVTES